MPLVVVLDSNGFSVEDVLGPWCATCYDVCRCAACTECVVSHMSRCARAIVQREEQHGVVHMSPKRWHTTVVLASLFLAQHGGP